MADELIWDTESDWNAATTENIDIAGSVFTLADGTLESGLLHAYDAQALNAADQDSITTFTDSEGSNDATGMGTYQSNGINGNPTVLLDGVDDDFEATAPAVGSGGEYTVALVVQFESFDSADFNTLFSTETGGYGGGNRDGDWQWLHNGHASFQNLTATTTDPTIVIGTYDGSTVTVEINGTDVLTTTENFDDPAGSLFLGSQGGGLDRFANAHIGEQRYHDRQFGDAERDDYRTALADKWDITL